MSDAFATSGTVLGKLKDEYDPIPGPTDGSLESAKWISAGLTKNGVSTPGVIAVAKAGKTWLYAFSALLQSAVTANKLGALPKWTWCRGGGNAQEKMDKIVAIGGKYANPGCAEKKILAEIWTKSPGAVETVAVIAHPDTNDLSKIGNVVGHVALGSGSEVYVAPCASCKAAWKKVDPD